MASCDPRYDHPLGPSEVCPNVIWTHASVPCQGRVDTAWRNKPASSLPAQMVSICQSHFVAAREGLLSSPALEQQGQARGTSTALQERPALGMVNLVGMQSEEAHVGLEF